jgi:hypothetical protein
MRIHAFLTFCILITSNLSRGQSLFLEKNGICAIEAEFYTASSGAWEEVEGRNAMPAESLGLGITHSKQIQFESGLQILSSDETPVGWGIPEKSAHIIANVKDIPGGACIFEYNKGDTVNGFVFPGYRLATIWPSENYTDDAWNFFGNLVVKSLKLNAKGNHVLMVLHSGENRNREEKVSEILGRSGFMVTFLPDEKLQFAKTTNFDAVIISESVAAGSVQDFFKNAPVPVIIGEPFIFNQMMMVKTSKPWKSKPGEFGNAVLNASPTKSDFLLYAVSIQTPGEYNLNVLGQNAGNKLPSEFRVELINPDISNIISTSSFKLNEKHQWYKVDTSFSIEKEGIYFLKVLHEELSKSTEKKRYPGARIDKLILLQNTDVSNEGVSQCIQQLDDNYFKKTGNNQFLPEQIWKPVNDIFIIEAENINHHAYWEFKQSPLGYTGKGFLSWQGPSRTNSIEGLGGNDDLLFVRQGPQMQWLIVRCMVENEGNYHVNVRNYHQLKDGDNDAWVFLVEEKPYHEGAFDDRVRRMGDSHSDGNGFTWLDWGIRTLPLKKGINNIYIAGRSVGWGIDRIAIYPENNSKAAQRALDLNTIISPEVDMN